MTASWNTCPIKQDIVKLLDYESRCNLRLCSKDDRDAVDSTRYVASELQITELRSSMSDEKTIIRVDIDTFVIWFIGRNDVTKVDRAWGNEEVLEKYSVIKQENRHDVAKRFLDRVARNGVLEAKKIQMQLLNLEPMDHWKIKCKELSLLVLHSENQLAGQWLPKLDSHLEKLEVSCNDVLQIADLPKVWNVSRSIEMTPCDLRDEHLDQIKATNLRIESDSLSLEAVRRALHRHLKYGRTEDHLYLRSDLLNSVGVEILPQHLTVETVESQYPIDRELTITGGFENVHGEQFARTAYISNGGLMVACRLPRKKKREHYMLWPFTVYQ